MANETPRFFADGPVSRELAVPRPDLESEILDTFEERGRLRLEGSRRVGKTSLVLNALENKAVVVIIDLYDARTEERFLEILRDGFAKLTNQNSTVRSMYGDEKSVEASVGTSLIAKFDLKVKKALSGFQPPNSLGSYLDAFEEIGRKIPLAVFFDEVQSLQDLDNAKEVIARLRAVSQHHKNVAYFFAGSLRHKMHKLFDAPDAPFFKQVPVLNVPPVPSEDMQAFVATRLKPRAMDDGLWPAVWELTRGITGDIQRLFQQVVRIMRTEPAKKAVGPQEIDKALAYLMLNRREMYRYHLSRLTDKQQRLLSAIARGIPPNTGVQMIRETGLGSGTLQTAFRALEEKGLIYENAGEGYSFDDPFFRAFVVGRELATIKSPHELAEKKPLSLRQGRSLKP